MNNYKQTIKELKDENLKYKRQLELSAEVSGLVFWEFDFKTNSFTFNEYYYKFMKTTVEDEGGYEKDVENYFESFIPQDSQKIVMEVIGGAFEKSADFNSSFEYEMRRRDGKILQVLVDLYISYDDEGQPDKSYGTKYDLTKRKKHEETLKIAKENAELINKLNIEKLKTQDNLLIQQSRHAAMGEMIGNIAHQWRQPLNALGLTIQKIKMFHAEGILSDEKLDKSVQKSNMLINKMSNTIDDFRNFFRTDKVKEKFAIKDAIDETLTLLEASLKYYNIEVDIINREAKIELLGYKNELEQVLLNIINNAKDALMENKIQNAKIEIRAFSGQENVTIEISDNAGGVPKDIIDKIFDPYFTTKEQGKGTGIGLYMSKMIIEANMDGKLEVKNSKDGVVFIIKLYQENNNE